MLTQNELSKLHKWFFFLTNFNNSMYLLMSYNLKFVFTCTFYLRTLIQDPRSGGLRSCFGEMLETLKPVYLLFFSCVFIKRVSSHDRQKDRQIDRTIIESKLRHLLNDIEPALKWRNSSIPLFFEFELIFLVFHYLIINHWLIYIGLNDLKTYWQMIFIANISIKFFT